MNFLVRRHFVSADFEAYEHELSRHKRKCSRNRRTIFDVADGRLHNAERSGRGVKYSNGGKSKEDATHRARNRHECLFYFWDWVSRRSNLRFWSSFRIL